MYNDSVKQVIGKKIADNYYITGEVGSGGMGKVFKAIPFDDPSRYVAIKIIHRNRELNSEDLLRFQKEATLMGKLNHPNIVCLYELGLLEDSIEDKEIKNGSNINKSSSNNYGYYIVMELASGINLKECLKRDGRKDLAFFFQVALQVTSALEYTHSKNIIHRDIKPQNIIVGDSGRDNKGILVKVLDFGVAKLLESISQDDKKSSKKSDVAGTPLYMAPEQTRLVNEPIDHRVDLYSLGCVLYEILAGQPPFTASSREKLEQQHAFSKPELLTNIRPDIPPIVSDLVHKLLCKSPKQRYHSAFALHADLVRIKRKLERHENPSSISFELGVYDRFKSVSSTIKMIGWEKEFELLLDSYNLSAQSQGRSQVVLLSGAYGIGKTKILSEFRKELTKSKVKFISVNFSQHENSLPFNALANGFNDYLLRISKTSIYESNEFKKKVKSLLGSSAYDVAKVVPGIVPFISKDIEMPSEDLGGSFGFVKAFIDFTRCFTNNNENIVFIFDDVHFADKDSLELIEKFIKSNNSQKFCMVLSSDFTNLNNNQIHFKFLEQFKKFKRRYHEIKLEGLSKNHISLLIQDILQSNEDIPENFLDYMEQRSSGNPLYIIELLRTLVSRDFVRYSVSKSKWEFNVKTIQSHTISLDSIDLVINKIQDFSQIEREIMDVASVIGMNFGVKTLLVDESLTPSMVNEVIQTALNKGIIYQIKDNDIENSLGNLYSFSHWKVRETLYMFIDPDRKKELHYKVAERINSFITRNSHVKMIFSVAHHINNASEGGKLKDLDTAKKYVFYNVRAAIYSRKNGSWLSSQRYYENAYNQIQFWPTGSFETSLIIDIVESLGDIFALQKKSSQALDNYLKVYNMKLGVSKLSSIIHKIVNLYVVSGYVSGSLKLIQRYLNFFNYPSITYNFKEYLKYVVGIIVDIIPIDFTKHRIFKTIKAKYYRYVRELQQASSSEGGSLSTLDSVYSSLKRSTKKEEDIAYCVYKLLDLGYFVSSGVSTRLSKIFEHKSYSQALMDKNLRLEDVLKVIVQRAALLGELGFTKISYLIFDLVMDVAKHTRLFNVYGLCALQRALSVDYLKVKVEDISYNLRTALRHISVEDEKLWFAVAVEFYAFRYLLRGDLIRVNHYSNVIPDIVPIRNQIGARMMSMSFFSDLLLDNRETLVSRGERYLQQRASVDGRSNDVFIYIINSVISFAKGELDKTRENYNKIVQEFCKKDSVYLYPFEKDYLLVFLFIFPELFEHEHGRCLMRSSEVNSVYEKIYQKLRFCKLERPIIALSKARCSEILGMRNAVSLYDTALKSAKAERNHLSVMFIYVWYGCLLIKDKSKRRFGYIQNAWQMADKLGLKLVVSYCEKLMDKLNIPYVHKYESKTVEQVNSKYSEQTNPVVLRHLEHICSYLENSDFSLQRALQESFLILTHNYKCKNIYCFKFGSQTPKVLYSTSNVNMDAIMKYAEYYVNIKSSLFIPKTSLEDSIFGSSMSSSYVSESVSDLGSTVEKARTSNTDVNEDASIDEDAKTVLLQDNIHQSNSDIRTEENDHILEYNETVNKSQYRSYLTDDLSNFSRSIAMDSFVEYTGAYGSSKRKEQKSEKLAVGMNALIPLRSRGGNIGLVLLEEVDLADKDVVQCRNELNILGTQLRLLIESKLESFTDTSFINSYKQNIDPPYQVGSFVMEEVDWLRTCTYGALRKKRETTWYLGLSYDQEHYMLAYCKLNGNLEVREKLGNLLWNYFLIERTLSVYDGKVKFNLKDMKDDISYILKKIEGVKSLDSISISISFFDKVSRSVTSGHFGSARPVVVNRINRVIPQNEAVLNFTNGSDLRYWDVESELLDGSMFMLSYDTSKFEFDPSTDEVGKKSTFVLDKEAFSSEFVNRNLARFVPISYIPRYYVAVAYQEVVDKILEESAQKNKLSMITNAS